MSERHTPDDYMICRTCGACKLKKDFYKNRWHRTGHMTACIKCHIKSQTNRYIKQKDRNDERSTN